MSYNSTPPKIAKDHKEQLLKGADLQTRLQKSWSSFRDDTSKASEVLSICDDLLEVQKSTGINCGSLSSNQVALRREYALDAINKKQDNTETFKSDSSVFKQYRRGDGSLVTVLK